MKKTIIETITLEKIVGGGQSLGVLANGKKAFAWGALPGETARVRITKKKSSYVEAVVEEVITPTKQRIAPKDPQSYLSTSPWQIIDFDTEQHYKSALIEEAFELHDIVLPYPINTYTNGVQYGYRNKVEFSWWGDIDKNGDETLDLAFFKRGGKGKIPVNGTSLAHPNINTLACSIRDTLRTKPNITARNLKTLLIRCNQQGECVWQLYTKDQLGDIFTRQELDAFPAQGGEVIYSDPRSPASRITKRLMHYGNIVLTDTVLGVPFRYATEGFFQINIPVYERALTDMRKWVTTPHDNEECRTTTETQSHKIASNENIQTDDTINTRETLDLYSGVGTIGLTIGGKKCTLVEINEHAVREMHANIARLKSTAHAILAPSEKALQYITGDKTIIVDPPRAGLHTDVINRLLEVAPERIIYLSCNPVTQARDVALLAKTYGIEHHQGYNFFPRTPHIEHLVVLRKKH